MSQYLIFVFDDEINLVSIEAGFQRLTGISAQLVDTKIGYCV